MYWIDELLKPRDAQATYALNYVGLDGVINLFR